jgi:long-chain acyl-CoA synthetase
MNSRQSMVQLVEDAARATPNRIAVRFMGLQVTYERLMEEIDRAAAGLEAEGYGVGDVITLCLPNVLDALYLFYAANKLGIRLHLVHPLTPIKPMRAFLDETGSKTLFIVDTYWQTYAPLLEDWKGRLFLVSPARSLSFLKRTGYRFLNRKRLAGIAWSDRLMRADALFAQTKATRTVQDAVSAAVLLHSGGTSGKPKTIELSNAAINALAMRTEHIMGEGDYENKHMLSVLPMFHGFGLCMGIHAMLVNGGVDHLMPKFDADQAIRMIKKDQLHFLIGVPSLFHALLNHPKFAGPHLKVLRQAYVGGDFVAPSLKERFNQVMAKYGSQARLLEGYGLTEVVTVCAVNTLKEEKDGTVGRPLPGLSIRTVDLTTRAFLETGEMGELVVTGDTLMNGYLDEDKSSSSAFLLDQDLRRWVLTGDYGLIDPDGYVVFKQRLKRIVKVSGMPVMPSEIETIAAAFENVKECAALGVPDASKGNVIRLYVALHRPEEGLREESLKKTIHESLSVYAVPREIVILDVLPKTIVGKIDTLELAKRP